MIGAGEKMSIYCRAIAAGLQIDFKQGKSAKEIVDSVGQVVAFAFGRERILGKFPLERG